MQKADDNTFRSQQQRPRPGVPLHCSGEGGRRDGWGAGRQNQMRPNYRNHNESVSRELSYLENTRAFGVHSYITQAHTFTPKKPTGAISVFAQKAHMPFLPYSRTCLFAHMRTLIPNQVWILIISLARPL